MENSYYFSLSRAPEFIVDIADFLNITDIVDKYMEISTYFLYTYLLPIDKVILSNDEHSSDERKVIQLLTTCFERLLDLFNETPRKYWSDNNNILMRLDDNLSLTNKDYLYRITI